MPSNVSKEKNREYQRQYRERHPERIKASRKAWYISNKKLVVASVAQWRRENPEKHRIHSQRYNLKKRCQITLEEKDILLRFQKYLCKICFASINLQTGCVDHVHGSNPIIVRGILCHACNVSIGLMKDDPERLIRAGEYVRRLGQCE